MYDRLTPLGRNITDAVAGSRAPTARGYFKSARLLAADDPSLITDETITPRADAVSARIRRDAYGVPHVYSDTDDGVIFGAGYVIAEDRSLLLDQARDNGIAGAIDMPGVAGDRARARPLRLQADARACAREVTRAAGRARCRRPARTAGRCCATSTPTSSASTSGTPRTGPTRGPFDRGDIYALNAIKAQFLGEGGGAGGPERAVPRRRARPLRRARGDRGLRGPAPAQRPGDVDDDAAAARRTRRNVSGRRPRGLVRLEQGSFESAGVELPGRAARRPPSDAPRGRRRRTSCSSTATARRPARRSSSAARRSATTTPA